MFVKFLFVAIALQALLVVADPEPSIPGPGDSYKQGGDCLIEWATDSTGKWTDMQIELKTGSNLAMVPLKVITKLDATKETRFVYPCPKVTPNSAIYFYEFTSSSSTTKLWTTRFTITDENGNSTPPSDAAQPNGDKIPWGTGKLAGDNSTISSPPSGSSSLPSSSSTPSDSSSISSSSSSSRLSSTRSPVPTQTGVNPGSSQNNTSGDMVIAVPKALAFAICLVAASAAFLS